MEKVAATKIDLIPITEISVAVYFRVQFALTTQNIMVAFQINREVPEGRRSEERKTVFIYLLFKWDLRTVPDLIKITRQDFLWKKA